MRHLTQEQAREFAARWLPAWTGNDPEGLAGFYSEDAFYSDPAIPEGVKGKQSLVAYFSTLLSYNPEWVWTQLEGIPLEDGFLNKWLAKIPVGNRVLETIGVCLVQLDEEGLIRRNEVYFDRSELTEEISKARKHP